MKRQFKVGDIAQTTGSRWPLLNHRLVEIIVIATNGPHPGMPYLIRRVDGQNWCFPDLDGKGRLKFTNGQRVWCARRQLLPVDFKRDDPRDVLVRLEQNPPQFSVDIATLVGNP